VTGELARVGPNILLTSDPDLVQRMSSARSGYTRSEWYAGQKLEVDHDNLFSTLDDKIHTKRRAQMAMGVSSYAYDRTRNANRSSIPERTSKGSNLWLTNTYSNSSA